MKLHGSCRPRVAVARRGRSAASWRRRCERELKAGETGKGDKQRVHLPLYKTTDCEKNPMIDRDALVA